MKTNVKLIGRTLILLIALSACETDDPDEVPIPVPDPKAYYNEMIESYNNEMVLTWDNAISSAIDNLTPTAAESRSYAMVTLAMHDALNTLVPKYETYALDNRGIHPKYYSQIIFAEMANAAVAVAAHNVLVEVAPDWKVNADDLLAQSIPNNGFGVSEFTEKGMEIGQKAASSILEKRQNDLIPTFVTYPQGTLPGEYRSYMPFTIANPPVWPENTVYAPDWGNVAPFGMTSGKQFRPVPPNPVNSPEYTADYNEVKKLGCNDCPDRTQDQSDIGAFFIENSPSAMNRLARTFAVEGKFNGWETARILALTEMVEADTHISFFEAKYFYNYWRPLTAIREGDNDGNDDTTGDLNWNIIQRPEVRVTPPLPTYPSSKATSGGAAAELFKLYFGTDKKSFTIESISLPGVKRSYESFSQLANEITLSRIYIGYNFRQGVVEGEKMGRQLAKFVFENNLRELD